MSSFVEWDTRFGAPLQHLWGMTETVGLPLMSPLYGPRNLPSMGKPVVGYDVRILDDKGNETPPGEIGQIAIGADPWPHGDEGVLQKPEGDGGNHAGWLVVHR